MLKSLNHVVDALLDAGKPPRRSPSSLVPQLARSSAPRLLHGHHDFDATSASQPPSTSVRGRLPEQCRGWSLSCAMFQRFKSVSPVLPVGPSPLGVKRPEREENRADAQGVAAAEKWARHLRLAAVSLGFVPHLWLIQFWRLSCLVD
jgi:hypothetical protein